ncbi:dihydrolipoamide acetyltransferase family protein [Paenibacillus thalictri]|uniref:Dihydrolipoamide acetyltransferase component of pyruvate dehydrogenase complex n=1 Tax=Paenibacillus thalictri TaxID=2527873 RepID=A0A4V2J4H2_9BACL|nr:dihydrolipoamide acetyltransferase family protein [Paenibacillus thalictri]TBL79832.1 2-oxo acid dehydrogenase subunit E2 [Paenibacillus thalictri]
MAQTKQGTGVTVPHLAESLVSATIGKWLVKPGDVIEQYDVLCELFTDKVNTEMPSPVSGKVVEIVVAEGETAAVGEVICVIAEEGSGDVSEAGRISPAAEVPAGSAVAGGDDASMRSRYSPAVLRLAADHGVNLEHIAGSGLGGRITRKDVEAWVAEGRHKTAAAATPAQSAAPSPVAAPIVQDQAPSKVEVRSTGLHLSNPPQPNIEVEGQTLEGRGEYLIDVTPMRNAIASHTRQSVTEIPHAWTMIEVDVTNLVLLRNKLKDEFVRNEGVKLTYLPFVLKAVVSAIKDYPIMNSVWAVNKIIVKRDINVSLLVGTEDFVVSPVIKKADQKSIAGLAQEIDSLTKKARAGKLSHNDIQGGTFTVNNTGSFGSILSYPIINYPQAAILTFESIVKKPVVIQDMIAVRSMANMCLSLDHRILDGVICGRFLQRVKENLEGFNLESKLY